VSRFVLFGVFFSGRGLPWSVNWANVAQQAQRQQGPKRDFFWHVGYLGKNVTGSYSIDTKSLDRSKDT